MRADVADDIIYAVCRFRHDTSKESDAKESEEAKSYGEYTWQRVAQHGDAYMRGDGGASSICCYEACC